jgi:hypothetical protein
VRWNRAEKKEKKKATLIFGNLLTKNVDELSQDRHQCDAKNSALTNVHENVGPAFCPPTAAAAFIVEQRRDFFYIDEKNLKQTGRQ